MVQNHFFNGFRSTIITILLVVMAIEMILPIYCHHWFSAAGRGSYTVFEIGRMARSAHLRDETASNDDPSLLVIADAAGESQLQPGAQFIWSGSPSDHALFDPLLWVVRLPPLLHQSLHPPPEVLPPKSARPGM